MRVLLAFYGSSPQALKMGRYLDRRVGQVVMMEFKRVGEGMYFPPTIPNGDIYGLAPGATAKKTFLMSVTDEGIALSGVFIDWSSIKGVSEGNLSEHETVVIHSSKYSSRDFVFFQQGMNYRKDKYDDLEYMHRGYPVVYALLNRIRFEQKRLENEIHIF